MLEIKVNVQVGVTPEVAAIATAILNRQPAAVLYCWQIPVENPRYLASFIELENTGPVPIAIVAVTAERCPPSS